MHCTDRTVQRSDSIGRTVLQTVAHKQVPKGSTKAIESYTISTQHDAEHATLTKNNTAQSVRNDLNGLNAHFLVRLFLCALNIC